ncbi:MAG TPA: phosphoribosylformylglycinamidine synthase subunit PurS [Candidatus Nitrosopelagicus sp.]|nr:phosphoribosylformylglycinamidine synthase subunit PurS [Candidatus Nitrosopelagicus sp.]
MVEYIVNVIIENKPGISDPEGDTILNDLVMKDNNSNITKIRSAKMLKFFINDKNPKSAEKQILKICDDLRIYNPLVSKVTVQIKKS